MLSPVRWIVRGDIDGFFGLALDNLVQLLLIDTLCRGVLGFPPELVYGRVLPAAAISILVGNVAYAIQARRLAERTGPPRRLRAALRHQHRLALRPRVPRHAAGQGARRTRGRRRSVARRLAGGAARDVRVRASSSSASAFVAERVRKATPRAALLSTLAGIALSFISLGFLFRTFAHPVIGLTTLGDRHADLLRPRAVQGPSPGRRRRGRRRHAHRVDDRPRPGRRRGRRRPRFTCRCRSSATSLRRSAADTSCRISRSSSR